jgi:hypothetical protein
VDDRPGAGVKVSARLPTLTCISTDTGLLVQKAVEEPSGEFDVAVVIAITRRQPVCGR